MGYTRGMNGRNNDQFSLAQPLTEREQEVLTCIGDGLTNRQIAEQLTIAINTAKWYTRQIYNKLGVNSREEAIERGRRLGLLASAARPPHNLPLPPTPFVGREPELALLAQYLAEPDTRLITIFGPGGIGKTRLALAAARSQLNSRQIPHLFAQGIYFVPLAALETADLLVPALAEALNFHFEEGHDPQAQLLRFLGRKATLLLLDNFEHLAGGIGLLEAIGRTAPAVKLLVTSRARLNLQAEQLLPLGGMAVPDEKMADEAMTPDRLSDYSAIRLFDQCARRVQPDFALTAENQADVLAICRRVEGMPLGLVLAAAWLGTLTPAEIAAEIGRDLGFLETDMHDAPERQRSLRAAFNHSWRLLSQQEQAVFARLSVFRGGFERQAAQTVAGASLRDLRSLLHKALLYRAPNGRYEIHELLRQFAAEKLAQATTQSVRDRHSAYYCTFLSERTEAWHTAQQLDILRAVTQEADNIRQAWQWALDHGEWARLARAIDSWGEYHRWRGLLSDLDALCQAIIKRVERQEATEATILPDSLRLWAKALAWLAWSDPGVALLRLQQALDLLDRPELANQDTRLEKAFVLCNQGNLLRHMADLPAAEQIYRQSLTLFEEMGNQWGIANSLEGLGQVAWQMGDYALAHDRIQSVLTMQQKLGDRVAEARCLDSLGLVHKRLGNMDEAERMHREALGLNRRLDHRLALMSQQVNLAHALMWQGKLNEAERLAHESLAIARELGYPPTTSGFAQGVLCDALLHSGRYHQAAREAEQALSSLNEIGPIHLVHGYFYLVLGKLALVETSYNQAQDAFAQSSKHFQPGWSDLAGFPLAGLSHAACCLDQLAPARQHLAEALESALVAKTYMTVVYALPFVAYYLATTGRVERGVEIWQLARTQPLVAHSTWFADVVGRELASLAASLPPEVVEAAGERGRALDLWATAESLLAELS
jgi:predicted ATPase/DNA-binding CsgD family transcriptional regulator/Flp pilus assembly protein TadD